MITANTAYNRAKKNGGTPVQIDEQIEKVLLKEISSSISMRIDKGFFDTRVDVSGASNNTLVNIASTLRDGGFRTCVVTDGVEYTIFITWDNI